MSAEVVRALVGDVVLPAFGPSLCPPPLHLATGEWDGRTLDEHLEGVSMGEEDDLGEAYFWDLAAVRGYCVADAAEAGAARLARVGRGVSGTRGEVAVALGKEAKGRRRTERLRDRRAGKQKSPSLRWKEAELAGLAREAAERRAALSSMEGAYASIVDDLCGGSIGERQAMLQSWDDHHAECQWQSGLPFGFAGGGGGVVSAAAAAAVEAAAVAVAASREAFWLVYDAQAKVALAQWDLDRAECSGTSAVRCSQTECPPWARRDSDSDSDSELESVLDDAARLVHASLLGHALYSFRVALYAYGVRRRAAFPDGR